MDPEHKQIHRDKPHDILRKEVDPSTQALSSYGTNGKATWTKNIHRHVRQFEVETRFGMGNTMINKNNVVLLQKKTFLLSKN